MATDKLAGLVGQSFKIPTGGSNEPVYKIVAVKRQKALCTDAATGQILVMPVDDASHLVNGHRLPEEGATTSGCRGRNAGSI